MTSHSQYQICTICNGGGGFERRHSNWLLRLLRVPEVETCFLCDGAGEMPRDTAMAKIQAMFDLAEKLAKEYQAKRPVVQSSLPQKNVSV